MYIPGIGSKFGDFIGSAGFDLRQQFSVVRFGSVDLLSDQRSCSSGILSSQFTFTVTILSINQSISNSNRNINNSNNNRLILNSNRWK